MATHGNPCLVTLRNIFGALPLAANPSIQFVSQLSINTLSKNDAIQIARELQ